MSPRLRAWYGAPASISICSCPLSFGQAMEEHTGNEGDRVGPCCRKPSPELARLKFLQTWRVEGSDGGGGRWGPGRVWIRGGG